MIIFIYSCEAKWENYVMNKGKWRNPNGFLRRYSFISSKSLSVIDIKLPKLPAELRPHANVRVIND